MNEKMLYERTHQPQSLKGVGPGAFTKDSKNKLSPQREQEWQRFSLSGCLLPCQR